jgi:Na+/glutamate symporter
MKTRNKSAAKLFFAISIFLLIFAVYDYLTECIGCVKIDLRYFFISLFIAIVLFITDKRNKVNKD